MVEKMFGKNKVEERRRVRCRKVRCKRGAHSVMLIFSSWSRGSVPWKSGFRKKSCERAGIGTQPASNTVIERTSSNRTLRVILRPNGQDMGWL